MKLLSLTDLLKKPCKRLAWWASTIFQPLMIFRWTGILAYRTISYRELSPISFRPDAQGIMDEQKPQSICHNKIWTITPPSDLVMSHVLSIKNGIADRLGNVFDPLTGRLISGATHKYRDKVKRAHIPLPQRRYLHVEKVPGDVAVFTASNQHIYWHWLLDVIPRLIMLEEIERQPQFWYIQTKLPFQHEMLQYMGVLPKGRLIDCDTFPMISASTLHVPCHQVMEGREFPKWVYQELRKKFFPFSKQGKMGTLNRIYISRAGSQQRRISNEEKLFPILRNYGFHVVRLEDLTVGEQVGLFKNAEVIVAPNGSGLANLIFCSEGTVVIEIFPNVPHAFNVDHTFNFDYNYRLSRALDLNYFFVSSSNCNEGVSNTGDYPLTPEDLVQTFDLAKITLSK